MKLTKNIRISLYILLPILLWMASGLFKNNEGEVIEETNDSLIRSEDKLLVSIGLENITEILPL